MEYHLLKVKEVVELTPDSKQFVFSVDASLASLYRRKAGQFVSLDLNINGEQVRRDYSICTDVADSGKFGIGVKRVENGLVSNFLNDSVKVGDEIKVSQPQGRFTYEDKGKQLVLLAAGSGITPILSILKDALRDGETQQIQLVYGVRSAEHTMFLEEILRLSEVYADKLQVTFFQSRELKEVGGGNNVTYREGRLSEQFVQKQIEANVFDQYANYFICGPEDLIKRIQMFLKKNFVKDANIHIELFTSLITKPVDTEKKTATVGNIIVNAVIDGDEKEVEINKDKYILDGLIESEIDPPYSCQGGVCGACMCQLEEGEVDMEDNFTLTEDEMEQGKILACISKAKTDSVKVVFE